MSHYLDPEWPAPVARPKYIISGDTHEKIHGYSQWQVFVNGNMACSFYGPQSFMAAAAFAKLMNEGEFKMADAREVLEKQEEQ